MAREAMKMEYEERETKGIEVYNRVKSAYLSLCRRHGLNPFDLGIQQVAAMDISNRDKSELMRLIVKLVRLERNLKGEITNGLFPLTVEETERSGYLVPGAKE